MTLKFVALALSLNLGTQDPLRSKDVTIPTDTAQETNCSQFQLSGTCAIDYWGFEDWLRNGPLWSVSPTREMEFPKGELE